MQRNSIAEPIKIEIPYLPELDNPYNNFTR